MKGVQTMDPRRPRRKARRTASVREWALAQVAGRIRLRRPNEGDVEGVARRRRIPEGQRRPRDPYKGKAAGRTTRPRRLRLGAPSRSTKQRK